MITKAYSKINISLKVDKKDENGYHKIESLMIPLSLHDSIEITKLPNGSHTFITCDNFALYAEKYNIVTKAIQLLRDKTGFRDHLRVTIYKRIFIAGGLGGGSSDAAAVLIALIDYLKLEISQEDIFAIAKQIGADTAFFLENKPAIATNYGEVITPANITNKYHVLLVKPKEGVSTKKMYDMYDEMYVEEEKPSIDLIVDAYNNDINKLNEIRFNDLQKCAVQSVPEIAKIIESLKTDGVECVFMTGSGSTVVGMSNSKKKLAKLFKKYYLAGYETELTKTI